MFFVVLANLMSVDVAERTRGVVALVTHVRLCFMFTLMSNEIVHA